MRIKPWGVRGSIPSPGPKTMKYGGNTTCIEVETDEGDIIILDGGTGIHPLSISLLRRLPLQCHIFFTHTHWDHIQGLPFFVPIFIPGNVIHIYGAFDPVYQRSLKDILNRQMEYCYFPVREAELKAEIHYNTLHERQLTTVGRTQVTNILMNHPVLNYGYRIEGTDGKSMFFTGDNEPLYNIYEPGDDYYEEYASLIAAKNQSILDFIHGVDVLIVDSAYTVEEYTTKRGWGHGTFHSAMAMAKDAAVKSVYLTHHEPLRSDDELDAIEAQLKKDYPASDGYPECALAREGIDILL